MSGQAVKPSPEKVDPEILVPAYARGLVAGTLVALKMRKSSAFGKMK